VILAGLIGLVVLVGANAFFVAFEFSVVASQPAKLDHYAATRPILTRAAVQASASVSTQIAAVQVGVTLTSLALGAIAEPGLEEVFRRVLDVGDAIPHGVVTVVAFTVALAIVVAVHTVLGELVPKTLAITVPERTLLMTALPMRAFLAVARPVVQTLDWIASIVLRVLRIERRQEMSRVVTATDLARMFRESSEGGVIERTEAELLTRAISFGEELVSSVMVPRERIVAVPRSASIAEVQRVVVRAGHSRVPVYGRNLDDMFGFVHAKDLLVLDGQGRRDRTLPLTAVRWMTSVDASTRLADALVEMRRTRSHLLRVVAPAGRTAGLCSLEDVLERLVGDIRDETDRPRAAAPADRVGDESAHGARGEPS